jgi:DNA mismatch repair protein MutL
VQYQIAINYKNMLNSLGFEFEIFSRNSVKLSTMPQIFERLKSTLFIDIINELIKFKKELIDSELEEKIIRFSCRESIKAGDELSIIQIKKLLEDLSKTENPYSCPHGRPTIINLSISELEKKFKRTGW